MTNRVNKWGKQTAQIPHANNTNIRHANVILGWPLFSPTRKGFVEALRVCCSILQRHAVSTLAYNRSQLAGGADPAVRSMKDGARYATNLAPAAASNLISLSRPHQEQAGWRPVLQTEQRGGSCHHVCIRLSVLLLESAHWPCPGHNFGLWGLVFLSSSSSFLPQY